MKDSLVSYESITQSDALLIIDMQNDFMPGGALPVNDGLTIIPTINRLSSLPFRAVIATQDWHPQGHCSFSPQGGPWPIHCLAASRGAALTTELEQKYITHIIHKGIALDADSNSAFYDDNGTSTGLTPLLKGLGVSRVFICGVALDVCVYATAQHSLRDNFQTHIITNATAAVGSKDDFLKTLSPTDITLCQLG